MTIILFIMIISETIYRPTKEVIVTGLLLSVSDLGKGPLIFLTSLNPELLEFISDSSCYVCRMRTASTGPSALMCASSGRAAC